MGEFLKILGMLSILQWLVKYWESRTPEQKWGILFVIGMFCVVTFKYMNRNMYEEGGVGNTFEDNRKHEEEMRNK